MKKRRDYWKKSSRFSTTTTTAGRSGNSKGISGDVYNHASAGGDSLSPTGRECWPREEDEEETRTNISHHVI